MDYSTSDYRRTKPLRLREIEVLIISAQDLKNVKHVTKMRTYAVVYVQRDHVTKTQVDEHGGTNPTWNEVVTVRFKEGLPESDVMAALNVDIYSHGHVLEKPVGSARVLLCDVLKGGDASEPLDNPIQCITVQSSLYTLSHLKQSTNRCSNVPPTRFLMRRESLSFSIKEASRDEEEEEAEKKVAEPERLELEK
ncbi:hypothetical protein CJ030_MR2G005409 [Morella rubra]|uniref:C2 domain-containing protein n=1 Tax=Morella rubra TaxID=262757 RepID=A0A6A1WES2_9ROSI|nr:hypothetical protein CJ030_MR2G005409 [Morella rubra]